MKRFWDISHLDLVTRDAQLVYVKNTLIYLYEHVHVHVMTHVWSKDNLWKLVHFFHVGPQA